MIEGRILSKDAVLCVPRDKRSTVPLYRTAKACKLVWETQGLFPLFFVSNGRLACRGCIILQYQPYRRCGPDAFGPRLPLVNALHDRAKRELRDMRPELWLSNHSTRCRPR